MNSDLDRIITKAMTWKMHLLEHFKREGHTGFLGNVSIALIDKTDSKDPKSRENYWMRTLKSYAPIELNIEDSV